VDLAIGTRPKRLIELEIKRGEELLNVQFMTESRTQLEMGYAGFFGKILTQVRMVSARSPADKAGIQPGDIILAVNGEPVYYYHFVEIVKKNPENELELLIDRKGEKKTLLVTPRLEGKIGKIGIIQEPKSVLKKFGFFPAIFHSFKETKKLASLLIDFIKGLITGETSARHVGGPIEIANFSYAAFRGGLLSMMWFIAFISLQLGIINLFPIPVFDGGQILVLSLEGLFRRDFSPKVKQIVIQIGFAIFIFIVAFVILNDISKRLPNGWESFLFWK
jgi:regulator of sigma E protease